MSVKIRFGKPGVAMEEQRAQILDMIGSLVRTAEALHPDSILGKPADLERLGLAESEKVKEVKSKWLEQCTNILGQLRGLRERFKDSILNQKLDDAVNRLEEMRRPLL